MRRRIPIIVAVAAIVVLTFLIVSAQTEIKVQAHTGGFPICNPYRQASSRPI
jgi:hypothetical protein